MSKEPVIFGASINDLLTSNAIDHIDNNSSPEGNTQRARIYFKNGYELSVIRGEFSYGGPEGLFEIMPSDPSLFDGEDDSDDVLGYLTEERVSYYINKIGGIDK